MSSSSNTYGVYSSVVNTGSGDARGVYSSCSGAGNFAFYGVGDSYFSNDVRIGHTDDVVGYKLSVDGKVIAEELRIQNSFEWPDYVFEDDYDLMSLEEVEQAIKNNGHLPNIPSAEVVESEGIAVSEMQVKMMEKIEELTLHMIAMNKEIEKLKNENEALKSQIKSR